MKKLSLLALTFALLLLGIVGMEAFSGSQAALKDPKPLAEQEDLAATPFDQMMEVISHKRCVNCHPTGDRPRQGEDSHLHNFNIQRGKDGHGVVALQCAACHQKENNLNSGVPGAPHWHLAPRSMGWEGMSRSEIAQAMTDPQRNGGRTIEEIEKHLTEDPLVLWVFEPGVNHEGIPREKPPLSKEAFIAAVKAWVAEGAPIPTE
ncbi:MAG: hypothetical protein AAF927_16460 [Bacteroidota bacterium]